jgi:hypothetical protein
MRRQVVFLLAMVWIFAAVAAHAAAVGTTPGVGEGIQCNYDLTNVSGKEVFDVEVVLKGAVTFASTGAFYDHDFSDVDPSRTLTSDGNTSLHWEYPTNPIPNNTKVHVGYTPVGTYDCPLVAIYWTDANHKRISSKFIGVASNHHTNTTENISNLTPYPIYVTDIRMACQAAALPLDALNATNDYLSHAMVTIADAATLEPGQTWEIPVTPSCHNCYCVTNFKATGEGSDAIFSPWVQEYVE